MWDYFWIFRACSNSVQSQQAQAGIPETGCKTLTDRTQVRRKFPDHIKGPITEGRQLGRNGLLTPATYVFPPFYRRFRADLLRVARCRDRGFFSRVCVEFFALGGPYLIETGPRPNPLRVLQHSQAHLVNPRVPSEVAPKRVPSGSLACPKRAEKKWRSVSVQVKSRALSKSKAASF